VIGELGSPTPWESSADFSTSHKRQSGEHLWFERFDRPFDDLFEILDELVSRIVGTIVGRVEVAEIAEARRKMPEEAVVEQLKISGRDPDLVEEDISIIRDTYKSCENPKFREIPIEDDGSGVELQTHSFEKASRAVGENPEDSLR